MTATCPGTTSSARAGFAAAQYISPAALGALLNNIPVTYAVPLAALIGALTFDLSTFCPGEQPALPVMTGADALALLDPQDLAAFAAAVSKWRDFAGHWLWPIMCQCDTGPQPAPSAPPAKPADWPDIDNSAVAPCWSATVHYVFPGAASTSNHGLLALLPGVQGASCVALSSIPQGNVQLTLNVNADGTHNGSVTFGLSGYVGQACGGTEVGGGQLTTIAPGASATVAVPWYPSAQSGLPFVNASIANADNSIDATLSFNCVAQSAVTEVPCCPQDPMLHAATQSILQLVTLIQRQLLPFAYIASTAHAGLTDQGSFAVSSILGIRIELTTIPSHFGQEVGEPTVYFDLGWVSVLTADGVIEERRIQAVDTVWTPRVMSEATLVGYSFSAGVVATITELDREP